MLPKIRQCAEDILDLARLSEEFYEAEVVVFIRSKNGSKSDFLRLQVEGGSDLNSNELIKKELSQTNSGDGGDVNDWF